MLKMCYSYINIQHTFSDCFQILLVHSQVSHYSANEILQIFFDCIHKSFSI